MKNISRLFVWVFAWVVCFTSLSGVRPFKGQAAVLSGSYKIRVLVVYTKAARVAAGSTNQIQNRILEAVSRTNQSFSESGINIELVLTGRLEIDYAETGDLGADLDALVAKSDKVIDAIHPWREQTYADLVSLVVSYGDRCYESRQLTNPTDSTFESQAFSVVCYDCMVTELGFPMALGKNMGARLDWYFDEGKLPYTYSHGYIFSPPAPEPAWRTVMTDEGLCHQKGIFCKHLWLWSNSQIRYEETGPWMGVPGGTRTDCYIGVDNNPDCDADNARVLNQTASLVANFRPEPPPPPPTPEILLVNDEGYYAPEVEHYYVEALQALQVPFDTWQTGNPGQVEPNISQLSPYHIVIWFTGRNISLSTGPSQMTETVLANWLPNQNCLLISSSDYFNEFDPEHPTAFMQEVLGAASITADVSQTEVTGLGPFSSMGTLSLIEPTEYDPPDWNFTDALQPGPGAQAAFEGNKGTAGLFKLAPGYRTSYLAFPLEMLPSEQDRVMLLERYLAACRFMNIFLPAIRSD